VLLLVAVAGFGGGLVFATSVTVPARVATEIVRKRRDLRGTMQQFLVCLKSSYTIKRVCTTLVKTWLWLV
jgi:hypothetical protein